MFLYKDQDKIKDFIENLLSKRESDELVEKYKKEFWNNANNRSNISCNLLKNDDLQVVKFNGYNIMLFHVPCASREQRPVFRTTNPYNGTFKRNCEGDYKCTEKEVRRMFADANDSTPAGGYRKDRETGKEGFTLAGLLMFGKYESIIDNACAPDFFPDYQEWLNDNADARWSARVYPDGTWEANLFQYYRKVLPRLQNFLPNPFRLEGNIRKEETSAHVAIREAFINLCVHSDFSVNANLLVKHVKNTFIFSNPGTMLITKAQYYKGGQSVCRNKSLQKMFMMLGAAEKAGSGVDKILKGWSDANWRSPYIDVTLRPDVVNLYLPMVSLLDDEVKNGLIKLFGKEVTHIRHNWLQTLALAFTEGYVSNERLRYALKIHKADIYTLLKDMCNEGYLIAEGHGRGMKYYLPTTGNVGSNIGSKHRSKRMSRDELRKVIMDCCDDWVSLEYISISVGKNADYLISKVFPSMLEENLIERMYPEVPRHPYQKYKKK